MSLVLLGKLLAVYPTVCTLIAADRLSLSAGIPNYLCSVPRSIEEILRSPKTIFDAISSSPAASAMSGVPVGSRFLSMECGVGTDAEPDKNSTVLKATFFYLPPNETGTSKKSKSVFIKLPTGRPVAVWIKGLGAAFSPDHKEVAFYTRILPSFEKEFGMPFPVECPKPLYAAWSRPFDRAVVVCDVIDTTVFKAIPDWQGLTRRQIEAQLDMAASLHAATWRISKDQLTFIKERAGASWLQGIIDVFASRLQPWQKKLWDGLAASFSANHASGGEPMCLSHADCRAGNMLFRDTRTATSVIMTDWEAVAITPYLWDPVYAMICGLSVENRRLWADELLEYYLASLRKYLLAKKKKTSADGGADDGDDDDVPSLAQAKITRMKMILCIWYFGWVLTEVGGVGKTQGNSNNDMIAWRDRVHGSCLELTAEGGAASKAVFKSLFGVDDSVVEAFEREHRNQLAKK
jgi:hypothetical protein